MRKWATLCLFLTAVWCMGQLFHMLLVSYRLLNKLTNKAISNSEILLIQTWAKLNCTNEHRNGEDLACDCNMVHFTASAPLLNMEFFFCVDRLYIDKVGCMDTGFSVACTAFYRS